jgi:ArsR family transcriptional regulator
LAQAALSTKPSRQLHQTDQSPAADASLTLYKALADSVRLQILRLLKNDSFGVLEICRILDMRQSALSHHLKILANAGLVSTRREGNSIFYRRAFVAQDDEFREIKKCVYEDMDRVQLLDQQQAIIELIHLERAELSLSFFDKNADQFREQQGLIVKHDDYCQSLHDVIASLGLTNSASVMEVGPGEGLLLVELAEKYNNLTALDNSSEMLEKARQTSLAADFNSLTFILGDSQVAKKLPGRYDLIIFDMVLHHISSPAETFQDCAALLNDGGYLLVADLTNHDQDWVRESCGDLWLGFEDSDLIAWAERSALSATDSAFLSLRNGFQIQIRVFKKETLVSH